MGILERYRQLTQQANQPPQQTGSLQTVTPNDNQQEIPAFDTSNAIQSLAQLMGPTPAEREAEERRLANNKAKMNAWMGLFNGLGALGQLYGATKGASYAPMTVNPHQQIEKNYQQEMKNLDDVYKNRQAYAQQLYNWQRQVNEDKRKEKLADAMAQWYGTREDLAQQKSELGKLKAVRVIQKKDGSLLKFDPVSGSIDPLSEADPLYVEYMNSRINATNKRAGLIGAPVTTTTTDAKGNTRTSVKTYGNRGGSSKSSGGKYSKYKTRSSAGSKESSGKYDKYKKH